MELVDVHETSLATRILYDLLKERNPDHNISHKSMPSFDEHLEFVETRPYTAWYLIKSEMDYLGAVYLSREDEIGIFIFKEHQNQGYSSWAIEQIMAYHPRERYYANIAPLNHISKKVFRGLGFRKLQETYIYNA